MSDVYEKACFSKKIIVNRLNTALPLRVCEVVTHWFSGKQNVPGAAANKKGPLDNLQGHEIIYLYWFPGKGATTNSASYCKHFRENLPLMNR